MNARTPALLYAVGRFLVYVALTVVGVAALVGVVCLVGGWRSLGDFCSGLVYGGIAVIGIGWASLLGATQLSGDLRMRHAQSVSVDDLHTRTRRGLREIAQANVFQIVVTVAGALLIVLGEAIRPPR